MTEKITTVSLSSKYDKTLNKLAEKAKTSKKEYIEKAILFFDKQGINPIEYESPKDEMGKLIKRIDQVIAFMRVQERDILKPALSTILKERQGFENKMKQFEETTYDLTTNRTVKTEANCLYIELKAILDANLKTTSMHQSEIKTALLEIVSLLEEKKIASSGVSSKLKDLFSK